MFCSHQPRTLSNATCTALIVWIRDHWRHDRFALSDIGYARVVACRRTEALMALTAMMALTAFFNAYVGKCGAVPTDVARFLTLESSWTESWSAGQTGWTGVAAKRPAGSSNL
ncbi:hypothetical protein N9I50_00495 [bacterium]|nr:hypothetical protein [bacterium]